MPEKTNAQLEQAFAALPEAGKHYIKLIRDELHDLRDRVARLESRDASTR